MFKQKRGTYMIKWSRPDVGTIRRASGTTDKPTVTRMKAMLDRLYDLKKYDVLRAIKKGKVGSNPLSMGTAFALDNKAELEDFVANPVQDTPALEAVTAYIAGQQFSPATRKNYTSALSVFAKRFPASSVEDIPANLKTLREERVKSGESLGAFNNTMILLQGFLKYTLDEDSPLYKKVRQLEALSTNRPKVKGISVRQYVALQAVLHPSYQKMVDTLTLTGMRHGEYKNNLYTVNESEHRIDIRGTKTDSSVRYVPILVTPHDVAKGFHKGFVTALGTIGEKAIGENLTPHMLRHTFSQWLEMAGIPRTRIDLYMGHESGSVSSRYSYVDVMRFVVDDAATFKKWFDAEVAKARQ